jgi:hypothetical protein
LQNSSIYIVLAGFSVLASIDLMTVFLGPEKLIVALNSNPFGILLSSFVFDSWGTVLGLLGVILLFSPVLLGTLNSFRKYLAIFFVLDSLAAGIVSSIIWNDYFNPSGQIPYGASSIAISAQAIIFTMALIGLAQLWAKDNWIAPKDPYWKKSLGVIYATLLATTLWFVLVLEPIFVPSNEYNWRVHQIGFFLAVFSTFAFYVAARSRWNTTKPLVNKPIEN